jgi:hypothetical protein
VSTSTGPMSAELRRRLRVVWLPGSDVLSGICHCGASTFAEDPVLLWNWLLAHSDGHGP